MNLNRIEWIDVSKLIGIILVVISHTVPLEYSIIRGTIFSFHMPLFIIASGVVFKPNNSKENLKKKISKDINTLLKPLCIVWLIETVYDLLVNDSLFSLKYFIKKTISLFFSQGNPFYLFGYCFDSVGSVWFLGMLLSLRLIYNCICKNKNRKIQLFEIWSLSIICYLLRKKLVLPFSAENAMITLPLFDYGYYYRKKIIDSDNNVITNFLVWIILFIFIAYKSNSYLELASHNYPLYPLLFLCSIEGTMMVFKIAKKINSQIVCYLGTKTLPLLCIHSLDYILSFIWKTNNMIIIQFIFRFALIIIIFAIMNSIADNSTR